jgi:hypothetical protein
MKTKILITAFLLLSSLSNWAQLPSYLPASGLVAWYPFNGNANDESGNGNDGTNNGDLFSTENRFQEPGSAYLFNESGLGITFQNNNIVFGAQDLTISFWIKRQNCVTGCNNNTLFQTGLFDINPFDNVVENQKLSISIINEKINVQILTFEGSPFTQVYSNASNISFNSWIHLTLIIKAQNAGMGSNVGIYINGILDSMMPISYLIPDGSNPQSFSIGSGIDNSNTFNGLIDDFVIYNRELQPNEISQLTSSVNGDLINNNPVPPGIPYQAVARNYQGNPIANSNVQVRFSIRDLNSEGSVVYSETHSLQTDTLGLFSTAIGSGMPVDNSSFSQINWAQTAKFLNVELDFGNGWTDFGTQQLMSVPYALYAGNSQPGPQGPAGPRGFTGSTGAAGPQGEQGQQGEPGLVGPEGPVGLTGATGPQGEQGVAGSNGKNSLVKTSVEPSGATCPTGGVKMEHGLDTNNDGVLDESEINATLTQYVCNGSSNISNSPNLTGKTNIGFSSSGSWTCPSGVTQIVLQLWGAGGGSGACYGHCTNGKYFGGIGGNGGYMKVIVDVIPGTIYSINIGIGGEGGNQYYRTTNNCCPIILSQTGTMNGGTNGLNGGTSSFGNLYFANGGTGGSSASLSGAGTNGIDGLVNNYSPSEISVATPSQVVSGVSYIPIGYLTSISSPSCCASGGRFTIPATSSYCLLDVGNGSPMSGENGYCIISF